MATAKGVVRLTPRRSHAGLLGGDGREYRPPGPVQKPRGDFVVANEMPGNGDGQLYRPPCPAQKSCVNPWRRRPRV